jgi:Uma2 family endonuclease
VSVLFPIDVTTPRSAVYDPPFTDSELEALAMASEWCTIERNREGEILMNPPTGGFSSRGNSAITTQLDSWWQTHRQGMVFDCSGTFFLPDGSMLSPDACYVLPDKSIGLTEDDLTGFPRICPNFVIELLSKSDRVTKANQKMQRWIENGAALGWLIDPYKQKVLVYVPGAESSVVSGSAILGTGPVDGFRLDLIEIWRRYEVKGRGGIHA